MRRFFLSFVRRSHGFGIRREREGRRAGTGAVPIKRFAFLRWPLERFGLVWLGLVKSSRLDVSWTSEE